MVNLKDSFYVQMRRLRTSLTHLTTIECSGRAMLSVIKRGFLKPVLENRDIDKTGAEKS
jgi:hypothetical protein